MYAARVIRVRAHLAHLLPQPNDTRGACSRRVTPGPRPKPPAKRQEPHPHRRTVSQTPAGEPPDGERSGDDEGVGVRDEEGESHPSSAPQKRVRRRARATSRRRFARVPRSLPKAVASTSSLPSPLPSHALGFSSSCTSPSATTGPPPRPVPAEGGPLVISGQRATVQKLVQQSRPSPSSRGLGAAQASPSSGRRLRITASLRSRSTMSSISFSSATRIRALRISM
mmetsp:Transcript_9898/g.23320  ORF Transcript_9898/g.23320 Transcript_9898/m.23320 type:complete len:226 (-) Transcript_9898:241-918(-)